MICYVVELAQKSIERTNKQANKQMDDCIRMNGNAIAIELQTVWRKKKFLQHSQFLFQLTHDTSERFMAVEESSQLISEIHTRTKQRKKESKRREKGQKKKIMSS